MSKGIFIPDITVEMIRKAPLEAIETLLVEGEMYDVDIPHWTPCSEKMPKPNRHNELNVDVYYLAQTEYGDMIVASYNESHEGKTWWEQMYSYRIFDDEIVAWMPLPEPYKGGNEL